METENKLMKLFKRIFGISKPKKELKYELVAEYAYTNSSKELFYRIKYKIGNENPKYILDEDNTDLFTRLEHLDNYKEKFSTYEKLLEYNKNLVDKYKPIKLI